MIATVVNYGVFSMRTMIFLAISANAEGDFFVVMLCKAGFENSGHVVIVFETVAPYTESHVHPFPSKEWICNRFLDAFLL